MAEEKVILETEVKLGNSTNSVKSLKAELRQVTNELANLDAGSAEFVKMAQRAGELRDRIDDTKNAINAFNPEKKFQALADTMGIAVNGFTAIQGGMALFGAENKNLQEVMAKTQGAIALATGLNGLMGMKDTFVNLGGQVKNMIPILRSFSSAMIGALTGGIAIAITLIIAYWKDLKELVTGTTEAVILSNEQIAESTKKGHDEFKKAANERTAIAEREAKLKYDGQKLDEELAKIDRQRKIDEAVASGKLASEKKLIEDEYNKSIKDIREKYSKIEKDKAKTDKDKQEKDEKTKRDREEKLLEDKKRQQEELIARTEKEYTDTNKLTDEFYKKEELALIRSGATEEEIKKGQQEIEIKDLEQKIQNAKDYGQSTVDLELQLEQKKIDVKKDAAKKQEDILQEAAKNEKLSAEERYAALDALNKAGVISDKEASDAKIAIAKAEKDARNAALAEGANVLNQASELLGKNTAEGKALAVASATISTYLSAQKAFESFASIPVYGVGLGIAAASVAVASGLATINKILAVPVPGASGGGGGGGSMPSMPAAPAMRPTGFSTGQPSQTPPKVEPQKVYVVESDITNSQNKVARIQSKATIQ
jgi:hypothetical protein